jgi:fructosamine-3-kinase
MATFGAETPQCSADGRGALIDPACWWADREVDLAMTRLFGGFSSRFYEGYQREWPLNPNYDHRIDVYNLYHLLNHANLFGGGIQKTMPHSNQCHEVNVVVTEERKVSRSQPRYSLRMV